MKQLVLFLTVNFQAGTAEHSGCYVSHMQQQKKHFAIINKSRTISGPQPYSWGPVVAIINTAIHCKCIEDQEVPCIFCSDDVPLSLWYFISLLSLTAPGAGCYPRTRWTAAAEYLLSRSVCLSRKWWWPSILLWTGCLLLGPHCQHHCN